MPYINGYTKYEIKAGDTLYSLANTFSTTVSAILRANPDISANALRIGQIITIPFGSIVPTNISYTYEILSLNVSALKTVYPFLETGSIGKSVLGNQIPYIKFGNGEKEIFYCASTHANEWITTPLLMKFVEILSKSYTNNLSVYGYPAEYLFNNVSLYIVPMINPDGVNLVTGFYTEGSNIYNNAKRIADSFPSIPFPNGWKANLNRNRSKFTIPSRMGKSKRNKICSRF